MTKKREPLKCDGCGRVIGEIEEDAEVWADDRYVGVSFYCAECWEKKLRI